MLLRINKMNVKSEWKDKREKGMDGKNSNYKPQTSTET
jgi:hypothetical protein